MDKKDMVEGGDDNEENTDNWLLRAQRRIPHKTNVGQGSRNSEKSA